MTKKLYHQFTCSRMMLPEHREQLNRHREKLRQDDLSPPSLDEQEWQEFQHLITQSLKYGLEIRLIISTSKGCVEIEGIIREINTLSKQIGISTKGELKRIKAEKIVKVKSAT